LSFLKKLLSRLKGLKNIKINKIVEYAKSHRLMMIIILGAVVAVVLLAVFFLPNLFNDIKTIGEDSKDQQSVQTDVKDLSVTIPETAFPYPKSFIIENLAKDDLYNQIKSKGNFYGDIYELIPADGRNDLALEPMTLTYRFPTEFYFGKEYNNAELLYVENKENPVIKVFPGGNIILNENQQPVLETKAFHGSLIGIRIKNPTKPQWGLKKIIDKEDTLKPDILLVPGIDTNFTGFLPNTITNENPQGDNLWEITFPLRSIWSYRYPLSETRSPDYMREAENYFNRISRRSYLRFEAEKLAEVIGSKNEEFDIIAHGVGGLIARYAVEKFQLENVRKVVLISTPNSGTNIVNPSFLNLLYGKDSQVLSQIYGMNADSIRYLNRNNMSYLENVNVFYTDILPDSETISLLEGSLREDIDYFFIAGDNPDFSADLEGTQFEKFYPENAKGKGDGIVSVFSSLFPVLNEKNSGLQNLTSRVFPFSFFDIFVQQETLQHIYSFLEEGIETVEIPEYEDDTFREWMYEGNGDNATITDEDTPFSTGSTSATETQTATDSQATQTDLPDSTTETATDLFDDFQSWKSESFSTPAETDEQTTGTQKTGAEDTEAAESSDTVKDEDEAKPEDTGDSQESDDKAGEKEVSESSETKTREEKTGEVEKDEETGKKTATSVVPERYDPTSVNWSKRRFPDTFEDINNMMLYNFTKIKLPPDMNPYGLSVSSLGNQEGEIVYLFDNKGIIMMQNGVFSRLSDKPVQAYYADGGSLYVVQNNILTKYTGGQPSKMEYLMFNAPIINIGITDSARYYLLNQDGLTLETPRHSFSIDGHYGKIIMHGVYPYIVTDAAVYFFDGVECKEIYRPYSGNIQLLDGLIMREALYILASDYSLRAISLDGEKMLLDSTNNTGGFKLLNNSSELIIAGRQKFNIIEYKDGKIFGSYFNLREGESMQDSVYYRGGILTLVKKNGEIYLEKVAIMK